MMMMAIIRNQQRLLNESETAQQDDKVTMEGAMRKTQFMR